MLKTKCQREFERWAKDKHTRTFKDGKYVIELTRRVYTAWLASWQAALASERKTKGAKDEK